MSIKMFVINPYTKSITKVDDKNCDYYEVRKNIIGVDVFDYVIYESFGIEGMFTVDDLGMTKLNQKVFSFKTNFYDYVLYGISIFKVEGKMSKKYSDQQILDMLKKEIRFFDNKLDKHIQFVTKKYFTNRIVVNNILTKDGIEVY